MRTHQEKAASERQIVHKNLTDIKEILLNEIPYQYSKSKFINYVNKIEKIQSEIDKIQDVKDEFKRLSKIMPTKDADYYVNQYLGSKEMEQFRNDLYLVLYGLPDFIHFFHNMGHYTTEFFSNIYMFDPEDEEAIRIIKTLIKLCIRHINAGLLTYRYCNPLYILNLTKEIILNECDNYLLYFDNEMYEYTLNNCSNIKAVFKIFPAINSRKIAKGYSKWFTKYEERIAATKI